jgi:titin
VARNALGEARSEVHLKVQTFKNIVYDSSQPASLRKLQELEQSMDSQHLHPVMVDQPDELPRFTSQLNHHVDLSEGDVAHFEARIEPTSALVEWFRNGRPIVTGSRIRNINDFGFVMLEINGVTPNDTGTYTCRAKTSVGVAETSTDLRVNSKKSIILESQMPGGANLARLRELEMPSAPLPEEKSVVRQAPHFITQLSSNVKAVEGNTIHIDCRVEPLDCQIEWFFNGQPLRSGT